MLVSRSKFVALAVAAAVSLPLAAQPAEAAPRKPAPPPMVSVDNPRMVTEGNEGAAEIVFTIKLSAASAQDVTVNFATEDKRAKAGADYTETSGTLTFAPGEKIKTVAVPVLGDTLDEDTEHFFFLLSDPTGARLGSRRGNGRIFDNDAPPNVSIDDVSVAEGNEGTSTLAFSVSLSAPSGKTISVRYATANGTATVAGADYTAAADLLTFVPGEASKTVEVSVKGDTAVEPDESFSVKLTSPLNATLADAEGTGTITNDD